METDTNDNDLFDCLTGPLFRRCSASQDALHLNDVTLQNTVWYAVTINPQPTKLCNKRQYRKYTDDQQIGILTRMEAKLRRENPSIELVELHFEKCPVLGQMHFHAKYSMPAIFVTTMENYWRRVLDSSDSKTKIPWRYLDIQLVYNDQGWLEYIRKENKTGKKFNLFKTPMTYYHKKGGHAGGVDTTPQ